MDELVQLDSHIQALKRLKDKLALEKDTLFKEQDHVENDLLGATNKIKMLVASQIGRGAGMEAILGETYSRAKHKQFSSATDYVDHLKQSQNEIREYTSKIEACIANLEKCKTDTQRQLETNRRWHQEAENLLK